MLVKLQLATHLVKNCRGDKLIVGGTHSLLGGHNNCRGTHNCRGNYSYVGKHTICKGETLFAEGRHYFSCSQITLVVLDTHQLQKLESSHQFRADTRNVAKATDTQHAHFVGGVHQPSQQAVHHQLHQVPVVHTLLIDQLQDSHPRLINSKQ